MADKSSGIDFDRQVFVQPDLPKSRPATPIAGIIFALVAVAAIAFLAYKLSPQNVGDSAKPNDQALADVNSHLAEIEKRLDRLEALRGASLKQEEDEPSERQEPVSTSRGKVVHQAPASGAKPAQVPAGSAASGADAATIQRLAAVQNGVAALKNEEASNQEAWQATTDRVAEMAGQVGSQSVEVLRNRDELDEVLADTEMEAIPFELYRGANPSPVGPVSLSLKTASPKHQSYTLCVYIQNSCTELKNRTLHEVVQFAVAKNSVPLRVVGTKISDDEMVGYLEVPRSGSGH
jgi:hypothetical protein